MNRSYANRSNGDGTKENTYRYCIPGSKCSSEDKLSYVQILAMAGTTVTAAGVTETLMVLLAKGVFDKMSQAALNVVVQKVLEVASKESNFLNSHGVIFRFTYVCTLINHRDGAWNEDIWFYGEEPAFTNHTFY